MTALVDKLVQRHVEGRRPLRILGFAFAMRDKKPEMWARNPQAKLAGTQRGFCDKSTDRALG